MCARFIRLSFLGILSTLFLLPTALLAGEKQEKMKSEMEKTKTEMERAAEEVQQVDPAAGPTGEEDAIKYDEEGVMVIPESKAIYKKSDTEKTKDQPEPE
ncbi:hypothetical protein [Emcibacter sp.]|uniref:hypothetical protein n=1 Tax=Emcibacter sp. TaxID=1979954 RepID=UPI002AA88BFB|nr:hypothetical protein [Emcibacter sp.]